MKPPLFHGVITGAEHLSQNEIGALASFFEFFKVKFVEAKAFISFQNWGFAPVMMPLRRGGFSPLPPLLSLHRTLPLFVFLFLSFLLSPPQSTSFCLLLSYSLSPSPFPSSSPDPLCWAHWLSMAWYRTVSYHLPLVMGACSGTMDLGSYHMCSNCMVD